MSKLAGNVALITGAAAGQGAAELVLFLASERSSFISGAEISIDGGYIAAATVHLPNRFRGNMPPP